MAKKRKSRKKKPAFSLVNELHEGIGKIATVTRAGDVRVNRTDLRKVVDAIFLGAAKRAARGERVRFPVVGALVRKDVKARKAGKGVNPFTGEPMKIKARGKSKKPRWSLPKFLRVMFANKRNW